MTAVIDLVGELHAMVDRLLAVDAGVLSSAELQELVAGVHSESTRLALATADQQHAWAERGAWRADGSLTAALALARDAHQDHRSTRRRLHHARLLQQMPATRAALLAGRLSFDHVELLVRYATPARFELFAEHEQLLVDRLAGLVVFDDARQAVQHWAQLADDTLGRPHRRPAPSTLYLSRLADTGEAIVDGHLAPIDAEIVERELTRLVKQIRLADRAAGIERTPAQRRAAGLVQMATRSAGASGVTPRPLFQVFVGDDTARRLCQLASGPVIHPDDLADHLDDALFETFLFDGPTTIISVSRQRTFTGALRRAIQVRDRRCQHRSGCPTPAIDCDIDHRLPVVRGGPTSQFNGQAECLPHNRLPHLHDQPELQPEREITRFDELRCRLRWSLARRRTRAPVDDPPHHWDVITLPWAS